MKFNDFPKAHQKSLFNASRLRKASRRHAFLDLPRFGVRFGRRFGPQNEQNGIKNRAKKLDRNLMRERGRTFRGLCAPTGSDRRNVQASLGDYGGLWKTRRKILGTKMAGT